MKTSKQRRKSNINIATVIIPLAAIAVAIVAVLYVLIKYNTPEAKNGIGETTQTVTPVVKASEEELPDYTNETLYKGNWAEYPDLYQIPFQKSDAYIKNKDFATDNPEVVKECVNDATQFMEQLCNFNYRDNIANKAQYLGKLNLNIDYNAQITHNFNTEEERTEYFCYYLQNLVDKNIENQLEMEAKFYTDESLVYSDYYIFVRGELVFTIYSNADENSEYETGKEYAIPMEVAMHRDPENNTDRVITSFGKAKDNTFFLNP